MMQAHVSRLEHVACADSLERDSLISSTRRCNRGMLDLKRSFVLFLLDREEKNGMVVVGDGDVSVPVSVPVPS